MRLRGGGTPRAGGQCGTPLLARPATLGEGEGMDENITRDGLLRLAGLAGIAAAGGAVGLAAPGSAGAQSPTGDYAILYVSRDGRDSNNGQSWRTPREKSRPL